MEGVPEEPGFYWCNALDDGPWILLYFNGEEGIDRENNVAYSLIENYAWSEKIEPPE